MTEETLFIEALEIRDPAERAAFLDRACAGDAAVRGRLDRLLDQHEKAGSFLNRPAVASAATGTFDPAPEAETATVFLPEGPGMIVGPYRLLQQIGEGGMGTVYMAEQTHPIRRKVALKIIKPGMDSKQVVARFEAERQALALMDHVNIARVLDGGTTETGRPYFVMELVHGVPITKYCDDNHLTPRQRLELFVPVCQAIQHAHQKGIIHRDVKPSNVMVTLYDGKPVPKVIDFGIAKATEQKLTDRTLFTQYGTMVGTLEYMSPEQAEMSALGVDTSSDIYSLGVLLYELLTGSTPLSYKRVKEAGYAEILRMIKEEEPPKPSTRLSDSGEALASISAQRHMEPGKLTRLVRGELDWIVMKTLEKDRNRRYETANAFAADVQRYLADEPVLACPPSAWYRFRKFVRRNKAGLAAAGLVLSFLILLGGGAGWVLHDRSNRLAVTADQVEQALAESEGLYRQGKLPEAVAIAQKAWGLLQSGGGSEALERRVREWLADLDMVARLEEWSCQGIDLDRAESDAGYLRIFRDYGIDVELLPPAEAAERIAARPIKVDLAVTLDRLAWSRKFAREDPARWRPLLDIARAADPDPWRNRLRDTLGQKDGVRELLQQLAASVDPAALPPPSWRSLAWGLMEAGDLDGAIAALRKVQRQYPDDFRMNLDLAMLLSDQKTPAGWDEAIGFNRAAVALRPRSSAAHNSLGVCLDHRGHLDGALTEFRIAIRLKPDNALAHTNLGIVLGKKGLWQEAIAASREAVRLKPDHAQAHVNLGEALMKMGLLDEAIAAYKEAVRLKPDYAQAHANLGRALIRKGLLDEAIASCKEAIRLKPDHAFAHSHLGYALFEKGLMDDALAADKEAIRLKPDYAEAHANLGNVLLNKGLLGDAIASYREAIRLKPDLAIAHTNLGFTLFKTGLVDESVVACREAIRLKPDLAEAHNNLGIALNEKGLAAEAIVAWREAVRLKPEFADAHFNLGVALGKKELWDEAIVAYREAIRLKPDLAVAHHNLGLALDTKGLWKEAIAAHREAIRLKPDYHQAHGSLGTALRRQGRPDEAIPAYREAIRLKPDEFMYHYNLGLVLLLEKKEFDAALAAFREAVRLKPDSPEAHLNVGKALYEKRAWDDAIVAFKEVVRLKPDWPTPYNLLGIALRQKGRTDEAIAAFREAIRLSPNFDRAHYHLGSALAAKGDTDAAIAAYRKAIVLNPKNADAPRALGLLLNNTAWSLATHPDPKRRDPARAVELAKEAVGLAPKLSWNTLGAAYYRAGDWKTAVAALERSMKARDGGDSFDWFFLAMAHRRLGNLEEARAWYDKAAGWMEKNQPANEELRRFRAEAAELLRVAVEVAPAPREKK